MRVVIIEKPCLLFIKVTFKGELCVVSRVVGMGLSFITSPSQLIPDPLLTTHPHPYYSLPNPSTYNEK